MDVKLCFLIPDSSRKSLVGLLLVFALLMDLGADLLSNNFVFISFFYLVLVEEYSSLLLYFRL